MGTRKARRTVRPANIKPRWNAKNRTLYPGRRIVKRFEQPAEIQEIILAAFETKGWPVRIANPLQGAGKKRRLHQAIENLNRDQRTRLIHFYGDRTGEGNLVRRAPPARKIDY